MVEILAEQNPWWQNPNWWEQDIHLKRLKEIRFVYERKKYIPEKNGVIVVYGPRQVGKTTWIKKTILEKVKSGKPTETFYLNAEIIKEWAELYDSIKTINNLYNPKHVFIDEISSVLDWEKAIKALADEGFFEKKQAILTGSSSLNILKRAERLPGRLAEGKNKFRFYPLSFKEVAELYGIKASNPKEAILQAKQLNTILHKYFLHGGFIKAINSLDKNGFLDEELFSIFSAWVDGELVKAKKSPELANFIMDGIANALTNEISWSALSKNASHPTIADYAETLKNMLAVDFLEKSKRALEGTPKNKKIYFTDPFIYWLALFKSRKINSASASSIDSATAGKLAELSAFSNLLQDLDSRLNESDFDIRRHLFFEKRKTSETDFMLKINNKTFRIECKFGKIEKEKKGTIYLTKDSFAKNKIPLAAFLMFPIESLKLAKIRH